MGAPGAQTTLNVPWSVVKTKLKWASVRFKSITDKASKPNTPDYDGR